MEKKLYFDELNYVFRLPDPVALKFVKKFKQKPKMYKMSEIILLTRQNIKT